MRWAVATPIYTPRTHIPVAIMPIYAYRCDACGFRKDVLQKMSDPALSTCPSCGAASFAKQLSAPAFQLKGTGWYVTDFRDKAKKADGAADAVRDGAVADGSSDKNRGADKASDGKSEPAPAPAANGSGAGASPTAPAPTPAAKPAGTATGTSGGSSDAN